MEPRDAFLTTGRSGWLGCDGRLAAAVFLVMLATATPASAIDAPGAPGDASTWAPAAKDFLGTALNDTSRVYFTGAQGIVTEVFYPTLDQVQNVDLQFLVLDSAKTWGAKDGEEKRQSRHEIGLVNDRAMCWKAVTTSNNNKWRLRKTIFTDPGRSSLVQRVTFEVLEPGKTVADFNVYVLNNPAINNTGGGAAFPHNDNSRRLTTAGSRIMVSASEPNSTSSALACSLPWKVVNGKAMLSSGFVGRNDGWTDLFGGSDDRTMDWNFDAAFTGNVAQMGWIDLGNGSQTSASFDVVLAFGASEVQAMNTASDTLGSNLAALQQSYIDDWVTYTGGLDDQDHTADDEYFLAAMTLKCIQDKTNGAMIAGAGTPWGENQRDDNAGGYHLVWARDLFKFASALITAGDLDSAAKAVDFLFTFQMQTGVDGKPRSVAGRFPQNTYVDGTPHWNATQMDETAMPIILAWKLFEKNRLDLSRLWPKIKLAAEFLARTGPATEQERWEEMGGYSPSTIAAEIAGLVCAAELANAANDPGAARFYLRKADEWRNNVANWTFTTTGLHGNGKYYIRINANQDPDDDVALSFGNGAGTHGERYIVDGGFLELVRMGALSPNDWTILETIPEYDSILKQTLPGLGDLFFRYNYDGYGERNDGQDYDGKFGRGRLWPIFTAERGIYEITKVRDGTPGQPYRNTLKALAAPTRFIPEQVWNQTANITGWVTATPGPYRPGDATRSMQPLSWAMGEYINLIAAMNRGKGDAPSAVVNRYSTDKPVTTVTFKVNAQTQFGQNIYLVGDSPLLSEWVPEAGIKLKPSPYPTWSVTVSLPASSTFHYKFVRRDDQGQSVMEGGTNRALTTPATGAVTQVDTFR
jgi:glucoamylase